MARNNLAAKKLASAAARVLTSDTATPAEISCAAHALIQRQLEVTKCDLKMKMPTSDYLKKLMAPIPAIAPLRTYMTVEEYEDVVNRMDLRIAELEDANEVLEFKVNALQTQLASHGVEPVIK